MIIHDKDQLIDGVTDTFPNPVDGADSERPQTAPFMTRITCAETALGDTGGKVPAEWTGGHASESYRPVEWSRNTARDYKQYPKKVIGNP